MSEGIFRVSTLRLTTCEVKFKLGFKSTYTTEMVAKIGLNDPND